MASLEQALAKAFAELSLASEQRNWVYGRLGIKNPDGSYTHDVPGYPNRVYVTRGQDGDLGQTTAVNYLGVDAIDDLPVKMRFENGILVIREFDQGNPDWVDPGPPTGGGGAPSPHALSSAHHTGSLANAQGPQFLLLDGTRALEGNLAVDAGVTIDGVDLGNPGNGIEISSNRYRVDEDDNFTWTGSHTFNTGIVRFNTDPQVYANLDFAGGDRYITATSDLFIDTVDDLILGTIADPSDKTFRSYDYADGLPIHGFSLHLNSGGRRQLTINTMKSDELHTRLFVADVVRIDEGEEYWGKSRGIIHDDFVTPSSLGGTVTVKFEDNPAMTGQIFAVNDWLLLRYLDDTDDFEYGSIWGQVTSYTPLGLDAEGRGHQSWTFTLRDGATNQTIKKATVAIDFGASGQGYIHLSTLQSADGPWFKIGTWSGANPYDAGNNQIRTMIGLLDSVPDTDLNPSGYGLYSDNAYLRGSLRTVETIMDDAGLSLLLNDVPSDITPGSEAYIGWFFDLDDRWAAFGPARLSAARVTTPVGLEHITMLMETNNFYDSYSEIILRAVGLTGSTTFNMNSEGTVGLTSELFRIYSDTEPWGDNIWDLGSGTNRWKTIYANQLIVSGSISGAVIGGAEWQYSGSMIIDANSGSTTTVSITNQGAGVANLDVDANITLGGTIDGVDLALHVIDANAHHFEASGGAGINVNSGQVVSIDLATSSGLSTSGGLGVAATIAGSGLAIASGVLSVNTGAGTTIVSDAVVINLASNSGLNTTSGLSVDSSLAGAGMTLTTGVLNVIALSTGGMTVNANDIQIKLPGTSGLTTDATGLYIADSIAGAGLIIASKVLAVNTGAGIEIVSDAVAIDLGTNSGLNITSGLVVDASIAGSALSLSAGVLSVNIIASGGIEVTLDALQIKLPGASGLTTDSTGLYLADSVAGAGLGITSKVLAVNVGPGIKIDTDAVAIDLAATSGLNVTSGLALDNSVAGAGLTITSKVLDIVALSTGGLQVNADSIQILLPGTSGLTTDATGLYLADSVAGSGLGISGKIMSVNVSNGLEINSDNVRVNQGYNFSWSGTHAFGGVATFNVAPQINANLEFIGGARSITTAGSDNLTILPGGDLILSPTGSDVLPGGSLATDLGDYNRKWRSLYIGELVADSLVASHVMATIGGRIIVAPTTRLVADLASGTTTINVFHNLFASGDFAMLQTAPGGVPQFESIKITSSASGSPGNYSYTVVRNQDGTGANDWAEGDSLINTNHLVGTGYLELTSTSTLMSHAGPTITVYARPDSTAVWNNVLPVVTMGNLSSFVDYSGDEFGFATGNNLTLDASSGFSGFTVDKTQGMRLFNIELEMYDGADKYLLISNDALTGVRFALPTGALAETGSIAWYQDIDGSIGTEPYRFQIGAYMNGVDLLSTLFSYAESEHTYLMLQAQGRIGGAFGNAASATLLLNGGVSGDIGFSLGSSVATMGGATIASNTTTNSIVMGKWGLVGDSTVHIADSSTLNDATLGLTIENASTSGDSLLHFLQSTGTTENQRWTMGIDASDSNAFVLSRGAVLGTTNALTISTANAGYLTGSLRIDAPSGQQALAINGVSGVTATASIARYSADASASGVVLNKSRHATVGSHTIVQNSDIIGSIIFNGSDGTNFINAAVISAMVDGTPGTNDMPGKLIFQLTPDGSATPATQATLTNTELTLGGKLQLSNASVAHGMTTIVPTNVGGTIQLNSTTEGGLTVAGLTDVDNRTGLTLLGIIGNNNPNDVTPAVMIRGERKNVAGTGSEASAGNELILKVASFTTDLLGLNANGYMGLGTSHAGPVTFLDIGMSQATSGGISVSNTLSNTGAHARVYIQGTLGDPFILFDAAGGTQYWSAGIDNSDSDKFKIGEGTNLGAASYIAFDPNGGISLAEGLGAMAASSQRMVTYGPNAKATTGDGGILLRSPDASAQLDLFIGLGTNSTAGSRSGMINVLEQGTGARPLILQNFFDAALVGVGIAPVSAKLGVKTGTASNDAAVGGVLYVDVTQRNNTTTGETNLSTYTVLGNTLVSNGQSLTLDASGFCANNANGKTLKLYFGTDVVTLAGGTLSNLSWTVTALIVRTGAATQRYQATIFFNNNTIFTFSGAWTRTLSSNQDFKITGQGGATSDVLQYYHLIKWQDTNT